MKKVILVGKLKGTGKNTEFRSQYVNSNKFTIADLEIPSFLLKIQAERKIRR